MVGYDHRKSVYELLRYTVEDPESEEIRFIDFLEDSQPSYILMIVYNSLTKKASLSIMQIRKESQVRDESHEIYEKIEPDNRLISNMVKEEVRLGKLKKTRKKSFDNFELVPHIQPKRSRFNQQG